ncbi:MAG: hypothetical protein E7612_06505 [Ruminococcaceae bacterium]|nr:hypothetical protein [Oscillospiraceae bacterium]
MKCRECGATMYLDCKDYGFKGKYDNYWNCPDCQTSCIEEVRFSKTQRELWHSENNGVKDEIVKYNYHNDTITVTKGDK